jgi:beta-glucanase (GH16 family)
MPASTLRISRGENMKVFRFAIPVLIVIALFMGLFAQTPQAGHAATNPVGGPSGVNWAMTFDDEFDGTSLNRNVWRSDYFPNGGNGEQQQYVSDNSHNNYLVQNGDLQIIARKESLNGQPYTSGIVHTKGKFEQKYGYFEMRAQMPKGKGFWPAFWLLPDQDNWVPEIDVMEILCDKPNIDYMTYHYNNASGSYVQSQKAYTGPDFSAGYHTFAVDWEPSAMIYYVDGVEKFRFTDAAMIPTMQMYVIANLAVGGNWPGSPDSSTVFPSSLHVDYIRVWQKSGSAPTATATRPAATTVPTTAPTQPPVSGNMISNGSFASWFAPWTFRNDLGATFSQDTTAGANGTSTSLKTVLPSSDSTQPWLVGVSQANQTLTAGQAYTLSFWAKAAAARPIRAVVQGQNSPYTVYTNQTANLTTGWNRYSFAFTPSASTSAAMLNFNLADATSTVWLDEVSLSRAGLASVTPTAYLPTVTVAPTSTVVPSAAPTKAPTVTAASMANLISNGSFTSWFAPWAFRNDLGATFSQDTTTGANGTSTSLKTVLPSSNSSQPWLVGVSQANKALTGGQSYTLTFWAKASASRSIRAIMQLQNSPYTEITNQAANLTTAWTRYTVTFTPASSTSAAMVNFNLAGAAGTVWVDEVSLCRTGYVCK